MLGRWYWVFAACFLLGKGYQHFQSNSWPAATEASVVVYGRDSCGFTTRTRHELDAAGVPYFYKSVDDPASAQVLHAGMNEQGISTGRYLLPMIRTNGCIEGRPELNKVVQDYNDLASKLNTGA